MRSPGLASPPAFKVSTGILAVLLAATGCFGRLADYDPAQDSADIPQAPPAVPVTPPPSAHHTPADIEQRLVDFIRWRNRRLSADQARSIAVSLLTASAISRVDERLIACLVAVESSFDPGARSRTGALGLGQLLPSTARELGVTDPHDVDQNLRATASYLSRMLSAWGGRSDLALVSYLEGLGRVKKQVADGKSLSPQQVLFVQRVLGLYDRI